MLAISAIAGTVTGWRLGGKESRFHRMACGACVGTACAFICCQSAVEVEYWPLVFCVSACAAADIIAFEIPDELVAFGALSGSILALFRGGLVPAVLWGLLGFGVGIALLLIGNAFYGDCGFGMGDVKALGMLGIWLGPRWPGMLFAAVLGIGFSGLALVVAKGFNARRQVIPFAPFLALASVLAVAGHSI